MSGTRELPDFNNVANIISRLANNRQQLNLEIHKLETLKIGHRLYTVGGLKTEEQVRKFILTVVKDRNVKKTALWKNRYERAVNLWKKQNSLALSLCSKEAELWMKVALHATRLAQFMRR